MEKNKSFFVFSFWRKIFSKYTFIKILLTFIVGFIFRVFVVTYFDGNVFLEYINYLFVAFFTFFVNEIIVYFSLFIIPEFNFGFSNYFHNVKYSRINPTNSCSVSSEDFYKSKLYNLNSSEDLSKFNKFKNKNKRVIFWILWEKYTNNFDSYKTFKENWDPNIKVRTLIKKDIKDGIWRIKVFKNTAKDIWNTIFK